MVFRRAINVMFSPKYLMATNMAGGCCWLLGGDYLEQKYGSRFLTNEEHKEYDKRRACEFNQTIFY